MGALHTDAQTKLIQFLVNRGIEEKIVIHTSDGEHLSCLKYAQKVNAKTLEIYKAASVVEAHNSGSQIAGAAAGLAQSVQASAATSPAPRTPASKPPLPVEGSTKSLASAASAASRDSERSKRSFEELNGETTDNQGLEGSESPVKIPSRGGASPATPSSPSSTVQMGDARKDDTQSMTSETPLVGSKGKRFARLANMLKGKGGR